MNKIQKLVAEVRNKLTPFTNLAYLINDAKDLNAVSNIIYNESKKCKELTTIIKELLENINKESDCDPIAFLKEIEAKPPYTVKSFRTRNLFRPYIYQIIFEDGVILDNLCNDNANIICDTLNGAYKLGLISSKTI